MTPGITPTLSRSPTAQGYFEQESLIKVRAFYPNPFKDDLKIYLNLRVAAKLRITVYNVAGEMIKTIDDTRSAGPVVVLWKGENDSGGRCASGTYVVHLKGEGIDMSTDAFWGHVVIAR